VEIRIDPAALADVAQVVIDEWVRDNAQALADAVAARAPSRTGELRGSHSWRRLIVGGRRVGIEIVASAEHALPVHQGRGPIRPIAPGGYVVTPGVKGRRPKPPAGFLRFEIGGRTVFAREVGPAAAQPWMVEALRGAGFAVTHRTPAG
jgi:hypothetical protein